MSNCQVRLPRVQGLQTQRHLLARRGDQPPDEEHRRPRDAGRARLRAQEVNRGGFHFGVRKALTREDAAEARKRVLAQPDSSDEEEETELLQQVSSPKPHAHSPRAHTSRTRMSTGEG